MSFAHLDESLTLDQLHTYASSQLEIGRMMAKVGLAALIVDQDLRVFVSVHKGVPGMFEEDALGAAMETFKNVPERGIGQIETPREVFVRCMYEEFGCCKDKFNDAGFYIDRQYPVSHMEWSAGPLKGFLDYFGWTVSLLVRVENPQAITSSKPLSDECKSTRFMTIDEIMQSKEPKRPGYEKWIHHMSLVLGRKLPSVRRQKVEWSAPLKTGDDQKDLDVVFPYVKS